MLETDGLVHLVNTSIQRQKRNIRAVTQDFDGSITPLHHPDVYRLLIENVFEFLPDRISRHFIGFTPEDFIAKGRVPVGWFIDLRNGLQLLTDTHGNIMKVQNGIMPLPEKKISSLYTGRKIDISQTPHPDLKRPRCLPVCDGFDYIEGALKATANSMTFLPKDRLYQMETAWRLAHDDKKRGFKRKLLEDPSKYGISPNKEQVEFMRAVYNAHTHVLLTSSPKWYVMPLLEELRILRYFHKTFTSAKKPASFESPYETNTIFSYFAGLGIEANEILHVGDHLYKDAKGAKSLGCLTALRATRESIEDLERKLKQYAGMEFKEDNGYIVKPKLMPPEGRKTNLSNYPSLVLKNVDVLTTKVQNLTPILLAS